MTRQSGGDGEGGVRRFEVVRTGERVEGIAAGIDRKLLQRLKRGEPEPVRRIDLHHLKRQEARPLVERELRAAFAAGERCVLFVHGRGLRSEDGPVLKEALLEWLQAAPLSERVMAFASARPEDGGVGALYVLLRRQREAPGGARRHS
jgi:DNA-nicking Smr family endonuclease